MNNSHAEYQHQVEVDPGTGLPSAILLPGAHPFRIAHSAAVLARGGC